MFRKIFFVLLLSIMISTLAPISAQEDQEDDLASPIQRCINLGNALDAPREGAWGYIIQDKHIEAIAEAGFDTIRVPIRWTAHVDYGHPYTIDEDFMARVDEVVTKALDEDLQVIINVHHDEQIMEDPDAYIARLIAVWEQLATHYQSWSTDIYFELLNEPNNQLTADKWNQFVNVLIPFIRTIDSEHTLIVGGVEWNSINGLELLEIPEDTHNLIVTVHYYDPFQFTHQGTSWVDGSGEWIGTEFDSSTDTSLIENDFNRIQVWQEVNPYPIFIGEFGAYREIEMAQRADYVGTVIDVAEDYNFGWCLWDFAAEFRAYDPVLNNWYPELLSVMIPAE